MLLQPRTSTRLISSNRCGQRSEFVDVDWTYYYCSKKWCIQKPSYKGKKNKSIFSWENLKLTMFYSSLFPVYVFFFPSQCKRPKYYEKFLLILLGFQLKPCHIMSAHGGKVAVFDVSFTVLYQFNYGLPVFRTNPGSF